MSNCQDKIYSNDYVDFILDFDPPEENLSGVDYCKNKVDEFLTIYHVSRNQVGNLAPSAFRYLYLPKIYGKMAASGGGQGVDYDFLEKSGISSVKEAPLSLSGRGVILAVIDTGVDYTSNLFHSPDSGSRIKAYWDQTLPSDSPPEGFNYGTEYRKERDGDIVNKIPMGSSLIPDEHGTAMTAIAAGNGRYGIAPEAEIVIVRLKEAKEYLKEYYCVSPSAPCYEETDLLNAYRYVAHFAEFRKKPLVVLCGVGTSFGDHAGGSFLSDYAGRLARKRNNVYVVPAGNEGLSSHHYGGKIPKDRDMEKVEIRVEEGCRGFFLEIWGQMPDFFETSIRSPYGEEIGNISISKKETMIFRFLYENTVLYADTLIAEQLSGQQLTVLRFEAPTPGIWSVYLRRYRNTAWNGEWQGELRIDMYLPLEQFLTAPVYFLVSSPDETLCSPVIEDSVLTVSAYRGQNGGIAAFSSRGYTLNHDIKPDFAAPGENIPWGGGILTGSSASAAITAGACALFLEWAVIRRNIPLIGSAEVKNLLASGCLRDVSLNGNLKFPNREWGYGKLNLEGVFELLKNQ